MIRFMMNLGIVPWPLNADLTGYWTMWATVATAAATVGLIVVAVFAWKAALRTLQGQQTNAEIAALKDYMNALYALARLSMITPQAHMPTQYMDSIAVRMQQMEDAYEPYVDAMTHDVEVSGSIWRAYHFDSDKMGAEFRDAERSLVEAQTWRLDSPEGNEKAQLKQYELSAQFAKDLAGWANRWQVTMKDRAALSKVVDKECAKFIVDSPCCPQTS